MGCNKDESQLNDYGLFGELSDGSGTWEVVKIVKRQNNIANSPETVEEPKNMFYSFFIKTQAIFGGLVPLNYAVLYQGDKVVGANEVQAEKQRVVFPSNQAFGGNVWSVDKHNSRKQIWNHVIGTETIIMTLKKCNCEIPKSTIVEQGG